MKVGTGWAIGLLLLAIALVVAGIGLAAPVALPYALIGAGGLVGFGTWFGAEV